MTQDLRKLKMLENLILSVLLEEMVGIVPAHVVKSTNRRRLIISLLLVAKGWKNLAEHWNKEVLKRVIISKKLRILKKLTT